MRPLSRQELADLVIEFQITVPGLLDVHSAELKRSLRRSAKIGMKLGYFRAFRG